MYTQIAIGQTKGDNIMQNSEINVDVIQKLNQGKVLVLGDIMLDEYLFGTVERISPEAPVPIVQINKSKRVLGGAGNVARNIIALNGQATLVSITGTCYNGTDLTRLVKESGIKGSVIQNAGCHTCIKSRVLAQQQQMIRLDYESTAIIPPDAQDEVLNALAKHLADHKVLIISDYAKGLISMRFMEKLHQLISQKNPDILILVDPKPENIALYENVYVMTPNIKEISQIVNLGIKDDADILSAGRALLAQGKCKHLVATLGPKGMAVFMHPTVTWRMPTVARSVYDVTGAGDTVIATLALALAAGHDLLLSAMLANVAGGVSVTKLGAATISQEELAETLIQGGLPKPEHW